MVRPFKMFRSSCVALERSVHVIVRPLTYNLQQSRNVALGVEPKAIFLIYRGKKGEKCPSCFYESVINMFYGSFS